MSRKEQILAEAPKHIEGTNFRIKGLMLDVEGNGKETNVTCLVWKAEDGTQKFIAIDWIWW